LAGAVLEKNGDWLKRSGCLSPVFAAENAAAVLRAIERFGAPLHDLTRADLSKDDTVFQIGVAPRSIDIITGATGLRFADAHARAVTVEIEGLPIRILSIEDLIKNKRACGRTKDAADVEILESHNRRVEDTSAES
jgi:hypothetical protein